MNDVATMAAHIVQQWSRTTLEDIRQEAITSRSGIVYERIHGPEGPRFMYVCIAGNISFSGPLKEFKGFHQFADGKPWDSLRLSELALASALLGSVFITNDSNALMLIGHEPRSIMNLEVFVSPLGNDSSKS